MRKDTRPSAFLVQPKTAQAWERGYYTGETTHGCEMWARMGTIHCEGSLHSHPFLGTLELLNGGCFLSRGEPYVWSMQEIITPRTCTRGKAIPSVCCLSVCRLQKNFQISYKQILLRLINRVISFANSPILTFVYLIIRNTLQFSVLSGLIIRCSWSSILRYRMLNYRLCSRSLLASCLASCQ